MNHRVTSDHFPYVPVHLDIRGQTYEMETLLDTGFDGDIAVPLDLIHRDWTPNGHYSWALADGSEVEAPYFRGTLRLGGLPPLSLNVTALGDEPILGRGVIDRFMFILDHGRQVVVEP
jgi:predicted aspartyl protease